MKIRSFLSALGASAVLLSGCALLQPPAPVVPLKDGELAIPADYKSWPKFLSEVQRPDAKQGLDEIWSAPFVGDVRHAALGWDPAEVRTATLALANPLSDEAPLLRVSVLSTMIDALLRNEARGQRDIGLFEVGQVVARVGEQRTAPTVDVGVRPSNEVLEQIYDAVPPQPRHLGMVLAGDRERAGWWWISGRTGGRFRANHPH